MIQTETAEQTTASAAPAEAGRKKFPRGLASNLLAGLRAAAFQKIELSRLCVSPEHVFALAGISLVLSFVTSLAVIGPQGEMNIQYLPYSFFSLPLLLTAAYSIARLESKQELTLSLTVVLISAGIWIEAAGFIVELLWLDAWFSGAPFFYGFEHYYRLFGWWCVSSYLIIHRIAGPLRKPVSTSLVFLFTLAIPFWFIPKWDFWTTASGDADNAKGSIAGEEMFYIQPALLENVLAGIKPGRKGIVDLYFVGFGSDSSEDVFMKEIDVITKLFDERFDTRGRSIALVNNAKTLETVPIATRTALERTIKEIGKRMNRDEDVLFLYLTSHGSEKHELAVNLPPLKLNEISPKDIKRILTEAGIAWKVVVVSACYSGGYIEPLKDEKSVIITSSDADNSSFGCGNDSDFTYFGKAYFDTELRKSHSFTQQFNAVKEAILKRELEESEEPSNPQIHIGAAIGKHLEKLEFRLKKRSPAD